MDSELQRMPECPVDILHAGLDLETAIDGKRANRQLQFVGKHEGTSAEHTHVTGKAAGTLREYHQRHTLLQHLARPVIGSTDLGRSTLVDKDMMCILASQTYQRNLADALLHHPLEVTSQEAVDQEDVESTLMIGNKHITLILLQMFPTLYLHRQEKETDPQDRPPLAGIISPEVTIAQSAAYHGNKTGQDARQNKNRQTYQKLI